MLSYFHCDTGELVVDQLLVRYGPRRSKWPKKLVKTLEKRNAALVAAINERLCYVPKEQFWPLGNAAKELITVKEGKRQWALFRGTVACYCINMSWIHW